MPDADYSIGGGWGNSIQWVDWEKRKVVGWKPRMPRPGDELTAAMQSGKTARFRFIEIDYCGDPEDMFFATVEDMNYDD